METKKMETKKRLDCLPVVLVNGLGDPAPGISLVYVPESYDHMLTALHAYHDQFLCDTIGSFIFFNFDRKTEYSQRVTHAGNFAVGDMTILKNASAIWKAELTGRFKHTITGKFDDNPHPSRVVSAVACLHRQASGFKKPVNIVDNWDEFYGYWKSVDLEKLVRELCLDPKLLHGDQEKEKEEDQED